MQDSSIMPIPVHKKYTFAGQQQKGFGLESVHGCNARCVFCCLGHYDKQQVTNVFTGETWYKQKKLMDWNKILRQYHCNWQVGVFPAGNWAGAVPREVICQDMRQICPNGCGQWDCTGPTIDVDGQIMLCCYNSRWSFGSVLDDDALGRWHNRREIFGVQGRVLHASPFCDECSFRFIPTGWLGDFIWA